MLNNFKNKFLPYGAEKGKKTINSKSILDKEVGPV